MNFRLFQLFSLAYISGIADSFPGMYVQLYTFISVEYPASLLRGPPAQLWLHRKSGEHEYPTLQAVRQLNFMAKRCKIRHLKTVMGMSYWKP